MHEEDDITDKSYMIEAIKVGVVDVVKFPLVKQSMRTLWQHAVRKFMSARRLAEGAGGNNVPGAGARHAPGEKDTNSGDSSASEERAVGFAGGRLHSSSPTTVLEEKSDLLNLLYR